MHRGTHYRALRRALTEKGLTAEDLPKITGLSQSAVNQRMAGRQSWRLSEAYAILAYLSIPFERIHIYFPENSREAIA